MKSILLILPLLLLGVSPLNAAGWKDLDLESAEISIIGDDSFVTRRRYTYNHLGATEIIIFRGGYLSWRKVNSFVYFGNEGDRKLWVAEIFNNSKKISKYGLQNISKDDVKESEDSRQGYMWVSREKNNMACMIALGEWGTSSRGGDNQINVRVCRAGPKENLEAFVHDLMKRVRIDGGVINKLKTSGKYTAPEAKPTASKTPEKVNDVTGSSSSEGSIASRLSKLKKLEARGLITKEEAAKKRKAILDSL